MPFLSGLFAYVVVHCTYYLFLVAADSLRERMPNCVTF